MPTSYDPNVIQKLADNLYTQAAIVVFLSIVVSAVLGIALGYIVTEKLHHGDHGEIVGGLIGAVLGYLIGQSLAFRLRVLAQTALCQKQIELNTRPIRPGNQG